MKFLLLIIPMFLSGCVIPNIPPNLYIASPVKGEVTISGTPVEGAVVTRTCTSAWFGDFPPEISITDKDGLYEFPSIKKFRPIIFLHGAYIQQEITISHAEKTYLAYKCLCLVYGKFNELTAEHKKPDKPKIITTDASTFYVVQPDTSHYETNIIVDGKYLNLDLDLSTLQQYSLPAENIPLSFEEASMVLDDQLPNQKLEPTR